MVGAGAAMRAVQSYIEKVPTSPSTVLIAGETGAGAKPLIAANCGAIPDTLTEAGDMSPFARTKILRAIESREVYPLGGRASYTVRCRFICRHPLRPRAPRGPRPLSPGLLLSPQCRSHPAARSSPRSIASSAAMSSGVTTQRSPPYPTNIQDPTSIRSTATPYDPPATSALPVRN